MLSLAGCRLPYLLHAASGQFRLLNDSIPLEEALKKESLTSVQKDRLRLVSQIKQFGETELGLKKTENYESVYLASRQQPIYSVSACPKDRLALVTWWFPIVGRVPYLGFFDRQKAETEKKRLLQKDLDVMLGRAEAYSTLGWFKDPVTLNLIEGSTVDLVETILHEMTHSTLYLKGQGEFNEGLANLAGKVGALLFLRKHFGPVHPMTIEAQKAIEDERIFSDFLSSLLVKLEVLYHSTAARSEKLSRRELLFAEAQDEFRRMKDQWRTGRFDAFGDAKLNNAYLMSIGLYHRHFHLFEVALRQNDHSIKKALAFFNALSENDGDMIARSRQWLETRNAP